MAFFTVCLSLPEFFRFFFFFLIQHVLWTQIKGMDDIMEQLVFFSLVWSAKLNWSRCYLKFEEEKNKKIKRKPSYRREFFRSINIARLIFKNHWYLIFNWYNDVVPSLHILVLYILHFTLYIQRRNVSRTCWNYICEICGLCEVICPVKIVELASITLSITLAVFTGYPTIYADSRF